MKKCCYLIFVLLLSLHYTSTAQWTELFYYPVGYDLFDVCFLSQDTAIAVGHYGVIRQTTDNGVSWKNRMIPSHTRLSGIAAPGKDNIIAVGDGGSIYVSKDRGENWLKYAKDSYTNTENLADIAFWDANHGVIVGDCGIVLVTSDGGLNWKEASNNSYSNLRNVTWINSTTLIAVGDGGAVVRSVNSGLNWNSTESGAVTSLKFVRAPDEKHIYAVGDSIAVCVSNDLGKTWKCTMLNSYFGNYNKSWLRGCFFFDSLCGVIRVDNYGPHFKTEITTNDGGLTWKSNEVSVRIDTMAYNMNTMEFFDREHGISVGGGGEIVTLSEDSNSIKYKIKTSCFNNGFTDIAVNGTSDIFTMLKWGTSCKGIFSENGGQNWSDPMDLDTIGCRNGSSYYQAMACPGANTIFIAINSPKNNQPYSGTIIRSANKGKDWKVTFFPDSARISALKMADTKRGIARISRPYFYYTDDGWETYDSVNVPDTSIHSNWSIAHPGKGLFIMSNMNARALYISKDNGNTWDSSRAMPDNCDDAAFFSGDTAFAWGKFEESDIKYDIIQLTTNGGLTWELKVKQPNENNTSGIKTIKRCGRCCVAVKNDYNSNGFQYYYISTDNGISWQKDSAGSFKVEEILSDIAVLNNEVLFAGGSNGTLLMRYIGKTGVNPENGDEGHYAIRIAPNPATDILYLYFDGLKPLQHVKVYNLTGEEILLPVIIDDEPGGSYKLDVSQFPTGVYFVKVGNLTGKFIKL